MLLQLQRYYLVVRLFSWLFWTAFFYMHTEWFSSTLDVLLVHNFLCVFRLWWTVIMSLCYWHNIRVSFVCHLYFSICFAWVSNFSSNLLVKSLRDSLNIDQIHISESANVAIINCKIGIGTIFAMHVSKYASISSNNIILVLLQEMIVSWF